METALGLIEIRGLATAIMVSDVMAKTADVEIIDLERAQGSGWMTVKISGNVSAVIASISAGKQMGELYGDYVSSKVIPRPAASVCELFCVKDDTSQDPPPEVEVEEPSAPMPETAEFVNTPITCEQPVNEEPTDQKKEKKSHQGKVANKDKPGKAASN